jgi:hypothetical protein
VLLLAALAVLGAAVIASLAPPPSDDLPFQRASGGLGLGPAVSADWSFFGFDPRLEGGCEAELGPIPGGPCYMPRHGTAVADLPPLDRR